MKRIAGTYYDGVGSQGQPAALVFDQDWIVLEIPGGKISLSLAELSVEAALGNTPRRVRWGERDSFVTTDHDGLAQLQPLLHSPVKLAWVARLEAHMGIAIVALVIGVLGAGGFAVWGVPLLAEGVAYAAPEEVSRKLGASTLQTIDTILSESELPTERQQQLSAYFRRHGDIEVLTYRKAERLGANALTLSANTVLFTDELVELAEYDEELLAVYFHELGHARLRHVERSILQNSAWIVLLSVLTGDFSGASELVLTLPLVIGQAAYSRNFERAADEFAVQQLKQAGISPNHLAEILLKLEASHHDSDEDDEEEAEAGTEQSGDEIAGRPDEVQEDSTVARSEGSAASNDPDSSERSYSELVFEYLSTHPATNERIAYIRSQAGS